MDQQLDLSISAESEQTIFNGAQNILRVIRPQWNSNEIIYKMLSDGITNKLVRCKVNNCNPDEAVLIRIYGNNTDILIDRRAETRNIKVLNKHAMAPTLYATFNNGLAYKFVPGCTLSTRSVTDPEVYVLVARHLAKLHKLKMEQDSTEAIIEPVLWKRLEKFIKLVPDQFTKEHIHKKFFAMKLSKSQIQDEVTFLKSHLVQLNGEIVFCHNDLLLGNVILTSSLTKHGDNEQNELDKKVTFIDFEYAAFNYQAFDIGNHFAEFAGVDNVNYDYYPNKELQYSWLREYAAEFYTKSHVTDEMLRSLYVQVNQFALASHLLWGIWSLIQAENSDIEFDFIEYALIRFTEYFRRKDSFLGLSFYN